MNTFLDRFGRILPACLLIGSLLFSSLSLAESTARPDAYAFSEENGVASRLCDGNVTTAVTLNSGDSVTLTVEAGDRFVHLSFRETGLSYTLSELDAVGTELASHSDITDYEVILPLSDGTVSVILKAEKRLSVCEMVSLAEPLPKELASLLSPSPTTDLLVLAATFDEVMELYGSLIAHQRIGMDAHVTVAIAKTPFRHELDEVSRALAAMDVTVYPYTLGFVDDESSKRLEKQWGKSVVSDLADMLLTLRPSVIVTNGKTDDYRSNYLLDNLYEAMELLKEADEPFSVSKLYAVCDDGALVFDYTVPLAALSGRSALDAATAAYGQMDSRTVFMRTLPDRQQFSLLYTNVGSDTENESLWENVTERTSRQDALAVQTPSPEPTECPTPEPTEAPTEAPSAQPEAPSTEEQNPWRLFSCGGKEVTPTEAPTAMPTEAPTEAPTAEPTECPTPEPTAVPTEPGKFAEKFLDYTSEKKEWVEVDEKNGTWIYRNPFLAVEITRTQTTLEREGKTVPLAYYTAHIYMRDVNSFRPSFASERQNGRTIEYPETFLPTEKPVLWITGDNMIQGDTELKGHIIRNGRVYHASQKVPALAVNTEEFSLEIVNRGTPYTDVLDAGILHTWSFGPVLIQDGVINERARDEAKQGGIGAPNPRTGIGMIEPGHLVAIVVDGRQPGYSEGVTLEEFTELFRALNCTVAYNLDGGVSTCMCFLGERINHHAENDIRTGMQASWQRKIPDGLMWGYSDLVPDELP